MEASSDVSSNNSNYTIRNSLERAYLEACPTTPADVPRTPARGRRKRTRDTASLSSADSTKWETGIASYNYQSSKKVGSSSDENGSGEDSSKVSSFKESSNKSSSTDERESSEGNIDEGSSSNKESSSDEDLGSDEAGADLIKANDGERCPAEASKLYAATTTVSLSAGSSQQEGHANAMTSRNSTSNPSETESSSDSQLFARFLLDFAKSSSDASEEEAEQRARRPASNHKTKPPKHPASTRSESSRSKKRHQHVSSKASKKLKSSQQHSSAQQNHSEKMSRSIEHTSAERPCSYQELPITQNQSSQPIISTIPDVGTGLRAQTGFLPLTEANLAKANVSSSHLRQQDFAINNMVGSSHLPTPQQMSMQARSSWQHNGNSPFLLNPSMFGSASLNHQQDAEAELIERHLREQRTLLMNQDIEREQYQKYAASVLAADARKAAIPFIGSANAQRVTSMGYTSLDAHGSAFRGLPSLQVSNDREAKFLAMGTSSNAVIEKPFVKSEKSLRRVSMHIHTDDKTMSDYQILVRRNIEYFEAGEQDVIAAMPGRKVNVVPGQVGVRCIHCRTQRIGGRPVAGTVYFPTKLHRVYNAAQSIGCTHLCKTCPNIPPAIRERILSLQNERQKAGVGKEYWSSSARAVGVVETAEGLRFSP